MKKGFLMMKKNYRRLLGILVLVSSPTYANDGDLDPTFNGTGQETTEFTDGTVVYPAVGDSVIIEPPNNQILVAGTLMRPNGVIGIPPLLIGMARYNSDGSLDTNFVGDGSLNPGTVKFGFGSITSTSALSPCYIGTSLQSKSTVRLQSTGKIVVACSVVSPVSTKDVFGVARFNSSDGSNDTTFNALGTPGFVIGPLAGNGSTSNISHCRGMAIQADDKIVCAGGLYFGTRFVARILLERYTADGVLDSATFNPLGTGGDQAGTRSTSIGTCNVANGVVIQPDQKIVIAGFSDDSICVARYTITGDLDITFNPTGSLPGTNTTQVIPGTSIDGANALALQSDGKIVVAGFSSVDGGSTFQFIVVRYNTDGTIDTTFGTNGIVTTNFNGVDDEANGVAIQADGKIVVDGYTTTGGGTEFALARYLTDGTLDPSFGAGGLVTTPFAGPSDANDVTIQPDGKIVAAGFATISGTDEFAVARYTSAITPPIPPTPTTSCITNIDVLTQAIRTKYGS